MKPRINMITLSVKDIAKAMQLYENGPGLPRMSFEGGAAFFLLNGRQSLSWVDNWVCV
jgi:hypothetical protein